MIVSSLVASMFGCIAQGLFFYFSSSKYKDGLLSLLPAISAAPRCPRAVELLVQLSQLLQEARVWRDVPVGTHCFDGLCQRHALVDHQVGQDQGG